MGKNVSYTPEQKQVLIDMRQEGYTFGEISKHFLEEFDVVKNAQNLCSTYKYITKEAPDRETAKSFIESRRKQKQNTELRRKQRILMDEQIIYDDILKEIKKGLSALEIPPIPVEFMDTLKSEVEQATLVLSDFHIGLFTKIHNSKKAEKKLAKIVNHFIKKCKRLRPKKIVLACIGDFIENTGMHKGQEYSTDLMLGEQVSECIRLLGQYVYKPLIKLGIPTLSVVVAGNHDRASKDKQCNDIGKAYLTRPIFESMIMLCEGYDHMKFHLEDGVFCVVDGCLYEHGDFAKGLLSIKGSLAHMARRQGQCGVKVTRFIHGHLHTEAIFNNGDIISNGTLGAGNPFGEAIGFNTQRSSQAYRFEYSNGHVEAGFFTA
jgi:hypothetical protein